MILCLHLTEQRTDLCYRKITEKAREYLKTDGYLCYEIGAEQAADVSEIMKQAGLRDITVVKDLAGLDRVVMGRK